MSKSFYIAALFGLSAVAASATEAPDAKYAVLEQLFPRKEALPAGCLAPELPPKWPQKNCSVTNDPKALAVVVVDERLKDLIDPIDVEARYFAYYQEQDEGGVIGWAFKTEDAAVQAHKRLLDKYSNEPERFRLWQARNYVVWLFRDPGMTDECFRRLEQLIQAKVDELNGA